MPPKDIGMPRVEFKVLTANCHVLRGFQLRDNLSAQLSAKGFGTEGPSKFRVDNFWVITTGYSNGLFGLELWISLICLGRDYAREITILVSEPIVLAVLVPLGGHLYLVVVAHSTHSGHDRDSWGKIFPPRFALIVSAILRLCVLIRMKVPCSIFDDLAIAAPPPISAFLNFFVVKTHCMLHPPSRRTFAMIVWPLPRNPTSAPRGAWIDDVCVSSSFSVRLKSGGTECDIDWHGYILIIPVSLVVTQWVPARPGTKVVRSGAGSGLMYRDCVIPPIARHLRVVFHVGITHRLIRPRMSCVLLRV